ncbi:MAG: hypothetical protein BWY31_01755 [Lentisphaerae bacterium ADurb.Bin242]|nr:MAG: hypothetical protein BWY31_01755 [Lentisphaerae bacterium ADurb.Bin242]
MKRKNMKRLLLAALLCGSGILPVRAADHPLVKDGHAESVIVLRDVSAPGVFAACELADYLEKITGGRPEIRRDPVPGKYPIHLILKSAEAQKIMPAAVYAATKHIQDDGFLLASGKDGMYLYSRLPRGLIYAAYEILKRYGDVRWFYPTEEGEYCPKKKTFTVPEETVVSNPSIPKRFFNLVCYNRGFADEAFKWQLRNNMIVIGNPRYPNFHTYGMYFSEGGHCFSTLLPDDLFDANPELFCLFNGKRYPQSGKIDANGKRIKGTPQANQPCTTNPETLRIMKSNLLHMLTKNGIVDQLSIINNDSQVWCECARCRSIDTLEEKRLFKIGTRYWTLVNELVKTAMEYFPGIDISVLGYQNFQAPPPKDAVLPDKRVMVPVAVHQRCYAHSMDDASCPVNKRFRDYLAAWKKCGIMTGTYEYTNMLPGGRIRYNPLEKIVVGDIQYYHRLKNRIYIDELPPYAAVYNAKRWGRGVMEAQRANFFVHYLQAYFLWDATADFEKVYNDAGSKFYGPAWNEVKTFKQKLSDAFTGSGIHFMYGTSGRALGKCIETPEKEKELLSMLDKALAKTDSNSVYRKRVEYEKECFLDSWSFCAADYRKIRKNNLTVTKNTPVLDGNSDKEVWKNATVVEGFKTMSSNSPADPRTVVKFLYDDKNLYLAVTAMEPSPDKMVSRCSKQDELVWQDNSIELFFAPPAVDGRCVHIVFNALGTLYDTVSLSPPDNDLSYSSGAVVKTRVGGDRWTAEIAIPFSALGLQPKPGEKLPMNVARNRLVSDTVHAAPSSWNSYFHGAEIFNTIEFR